VKSFDVALPAYEAMAGPQARDLVAAAYASIDLAVDDLVIRQVQYDPGVSLSVRYAATVRSPATGAAWVEPVTAAVDADGAVPGTLVVSDGSREVGVFRWPVDPGLPGLAQAADSTVRPEWWAPCGEDLHIDVVGYRPGRRAVLRGTGRDDTVFVKVLTSRKAARSARRLEALRAHGLPVPRILMRDLDHGVLVLEGLPGATLRQRLIDEEPVPSAEELVALLERLPSGWVGSAREVASPAMHAARHAALVVQVLPEVRPMLEDVLGRLQAAPLGPMVPVHGDFHDDQILIDDDGRIVGLLDVDGAGAGRREDDLGTMLAHQSVMQQIVPNASRARYLDRLRDTFTDTVGPGPLATQAAAALVGLATGPYRAREAGWEQETVRRLELALDLVGEM
jgi:aminoglycoside phosphotransferase